MTITYSLDHVNSSTESVNVEVAAKSELTLQSTDVDPKTGEVVSTYILASGDNAYPAYVTFRSGIQNRNSGSVRRISMTFSTWAVATDDVAQTVTRKPISATAAFNVPADMTIEVGDFDDFIGNAFSFLYASVGTGARNTGYITKLLYGAPQVV